MAYLTTSIALFSHHQPKFSCFLFVFYSINATRYPGVQIEPHTLELFNGSFPIGQSEITWHVLIARGCEKSIVSCWLRAREAIVERTSAECDETCLRYKATRRLAREKSNGWPTLTYLPVVRSGPIILHCYSVRIYERFETSIPTVRLAVWLIPIDKTKTKPHENDYLLQLLLFYGILSRVLCPSLIGQLHSFTH